MIADDQSCQNWLLPPAFTQQVPLPSWTFTPLSPESPTCLDIHWRPYLCRYLFPIGLSPITSCSMVSTYAHFSQATSCGLGAGVRRAAGEGTARVSQSRKAIPQVLPFWPFGQQEPLWLSELLPHPWSTFTGFSIPCLKQITGSCSCHFFLHVALPLAKPHSCCYFRHDEKLQSLTNRNRIHPTTTLVHILIVPLSIL